MSDDEKAPDKILEKNYDTFNYFFASLIAACSFVIVLPKMSSNPNTLLFCYFFIALSVLALFLNWYFYKEEFKDDMNYYMLPSVLCIIITIFSSFIMISKNKTKIQNGSVTNYYYKFNLITVWLILVECYFLYVLYNLIKKKNDYVKFYMIVIFCFCALNCFIIASNSIGLYYFSADG
jgi:hypothetical protein